MLQLSGRLLRVQTFHTQTHRRPQAVPFYAEAVQQINLLSERWQKRRLRVGIRTADLHSPLPYHMTTQKEKQHWVSLRATLLQSFRPWNISSRNHFQEPRHSACRQRTCQQWVTLFGDPPSHPHLVLSAFHTPDIIYQSFLAETSILLTTHTGLAKTTKILDQKKNQSGMYNRKYLPMSDYEWYSSWMSLCMYLVSLQQAGQADHSQIH